MAYTDIDRPDLYFNTKLYTGNGSTQSITGVGFQPDWVWLKARSSAYSHQLFDVVRGATKLLSSEETSAEQTLSGVTSFDSDGFAVGSDAGSNNNTTTFASWNWLAGNGTASNSNGSITSTVSANTTAGFSIVSYTGNGTDNATVGHGLSVTPSFALVKNRDDSDHWGVWHQSFSAHTSYNSLSQNIATINSDDIFKAFSSTLFTLGTDSWSNTNTEKYVAYLFAEKKGFSKFGSYTGNGNADGTFIFTGFKPAFVIFKKTSATGNWGLLDSTRSYANVANHTLAANLSDAESSFGGGESVFGASNKVDIVSNGIKIREASDYNNASGATYIYLAFAESPIVSSNGVPAVAR